MQGGLARRAGQAVWSQRVSMRAHAEGRLPARGISMAGDSKRLPAALTLLVLSLALCTDCRQLLQTQQQQQPASGASAPNAALSAPSTALTAAQQDAAAPLALTGPLPAGVVSLAAKKAKKNNNQLALSAAAPTAVAASPVRTPLVPWALCWSWQEEAGPSRVAVLT